MVLRSRREYLEAIRGRYRKAGRKEKAVILDEFCVNCGYNRKYAIRLLRKQKDVSQIQRRPGPRSTYNGESLLLALKRIWFASDQMCSKKLKAALPLWLPFYEGEFEPLAEEVRHKLLAISPATIDRLLKPLRALHKKGHCSTKPGTLLKNQIPIKTHNWDVTRPGFFEADTVAHCGNSMAGDFVFSLTFTDISGWTENRAVWGRGSQGVLREIRDIEARIAFAILGFDCDNGSEFLNHHLVSYFTDRPKTPVTFTRSRPYQKNDNAFVEQKNWTHVRQLLGYDRFDKPELVPLINDLYINEWSLFTNFFCPTLKLKEKQRLNSRYVKKYEPPQTPYQRLIAAPTIDNEAKKTLEEVYYSLNPFTLKKNVEAKLKAIFYIVRLPSP